MQNKVITKLNDLNLIDRFLFSETMENRDAYQAAVSILLEKEIALLEKPETEKELRAAFITQKCSSAILETCAKEAVIIKHSLTSLYLNPAVRTLIF